MNRNYAEFSDPRLAELYDLFCPLGEDSAFFIREVQKHAPSAVLDVGCGTGILTVELAKIAKHVIGLEPAAPMLEIARRRPGGENITWIEGSAESASEKVDLIIMTAHVAQFFTDDDGWQSALRHLSSLLHTNGIIIFDSRNPLVKPWERWTRDNYMQTIQTPHGEVATWAELISTEANRATHRLHYQFENGEELLSDNELIYRSRGELTTSLQEAGLIVEKVYGDWNGNAANEQSEELIFVARKNV